MAGSVADHVVKATVPDEVEADLASLWREFVRETHAARAIMSNLVVFRDVPSTGQVDLAASLKDGPLVNVIRHHPCRLIVLLHSRTPDDHQQPLDAALGIVAFGHDEGRHAVEQIAVRSTCAEASLPSIVRRFVLGDLPTSVWWADDSSKRPPLAALATIGRQFLYDSRIWRDVRAGFSRLVALIDDPHAPDLADLNWRRLAPIRSMVGDTIKGHASAGRALRVVVSYAPGNDASAWLLVGWLSSTVYRKSQIAAEVRQDPSDALLTLTVEENGLPGYRVVMEAPLETEAEAIAAELQTLGHDRHLIDSIRAAYSRLTAAA